MQAQQGAPAFAADKPIVSAKALAQNGRVVQFVRSLAFMYCGGVAGVLGLTGLQGFAFYLVAYVLVSLALVFSMRSAPGGARGEASGMKRFLLVSSPLSFVFSGLGGQLVTYILFWTLAYALVHLY